MKISKGIIKAASFMLFIVLALQLTGVSCYGEELTIESSNLQADHQIQNAIPDRHDNTNNSTGGVDDSFHCICHLSFTSPLSVTHANYSTKVSTVIPPNLSSVQSVSSTIYQPPRTIL